MACTVTEAYPKAVVAEAAGPAATPAVGGRRREQMAGVTTAQVRSGLRVDSGMDARYMLCACH